MNILSFILLVLLVTLASCNSINANGSSDGYEKYHAKNPTAIINVTAELIKALDYENWYTTSFIVEELELGIAPVQQNTLIWTYTEEQYISTFKFHITQHSFDVNPLVSLNPTPYCWSRWALVKVPFNSPIPQINTLIFFPVVNDRDKVINSGESLFNSQSYTGCCHSDSLKFTVQADVPVRFSRGDMVYFIQRYECPLKNRIPLDGFGFRGYASFV